jgi:hypothetical protein
MTRIKTVADIRDFIAAERETKSEADRQFMTVSIKGRRKRAYGYRNRYQTGAQTNIGT